jgi:hypothetical protein
MMQTTSHPPRSILVEVFPINSRAIPMLTSYHPDVQGNNLSMVGGKLAFRLQKTFPGHWIWSHPWIITDNPQPVEAIQAVIETLWQEQPDVFQYVYGVRHDTTWQPTAQVTADFVARSLWADSRSSIEQVLATWSHHLGKMIRIHRVCEVRGWVVQEQPALSVSITSQIVANIDVQTYVQQLTNPNDLIGLMVADKASTLKGTITKIIGTVAQHRSRLLKVAKLEQSKATINRAADNELVIQVSTGPNNAYDYVARSLQFIVRTTDYSRFHVDAKQALRLLRLSPEERSHMIGKIAAIAKAKLLVSEKAYNSSATPGLFLTAQSVNFAPSLLLGGGQRIEPKGDTDLSLRLRRYGFYKRSKQFPGETPIQIGVLNALPHLSPDRFLQQLQTELTSFHFVSQISCIETVITTSRNALEEVVNNLQARNAQIILALLSDNEDKLSKDVTRWGIYDHFKSLTIGMGMPSQVITQSTMNNAYALSNIALGMLSKLGNIPYVLAEPLPYADIVVGIDIARRSKTRLAGSMNATAIARIYQNTGEFLQYVIHDAPLEGETIPPDVLHTLFPSAIFSGKRVVIHRDGLFRGQEKQALQDWARYIGAEFHGIEIVKTGVPRVYGFQGRVLHPPKGSAFKLNAYEAFLISSPPPSPHVTPWPLQIRSTTPFPIEQAIHSVLALTQLHYGSLRPPRLPISIHYSDEIAYLALKGIKPKELEGNIPFWL